MELPKFLEKDISPKPRTSGRAIASLVLGVTSIVFACFTGIPAILLGLGAMRAIKDSRERLEGYGLAVAGTILGGVTTGFYLLLIVTVGVFSTLATNRQLKATNQLKNIAIGMHNYHDTYKSLPWTGVDYKINEDQMFPPDDRQYTRQLQLSWRVRLLPYIESMSLYEQFDFNQPWDSPHNKALIEHMPDIYQSPNRRARDYRTVYQAVVLPAILPELPEQDPLWRYSQCSTPFDSPKPRRTGRIRSRGFRDILDGASNVIMLVETDADRAVVWTKPDDWELSLTEPRRGLGALRPGGFLVVMVDGSVKFFPNSLDGETLRKLFLADDGQPIGKY